VDIVGDVVTENTDEGTDTVNSSVTYTLTTNVENLTLTGAVATSGTGNSGDNYMVGNTANNTLTGGAGNDLLNGGKGIGVDTLFGSSGNDVLEGMDGNDVMSDTGDNNLFNGGAGNDTMTGNIGNELFIGGTGNDIITTNIGADIIAFNRGDGQDTLIASTGTDNTITLGGGIRNSDLTFTKSGTNLILSLGGSGDQLTLQNWYSGTTFKSVFNLQLIEEASANFQGLVAAFDAVGDPANWSLTNELLNQHLSGSDIEAIGGDLAYQYGRNGTLANIGFDPAMAVMSNASFGRGTQTIQPAQDLQQGINRLS
jgi:Ca2+-binding RTX toxin-like protein